METSSGALLKELQVITSLSLLFSLSFFFFLKIFFPFDRTLLRFKILEKRENVDMPLCIELYYP